MPARREPTSSLWPEEQDELATKLRYGIGLEQLIGDGPAQEIRARLPLPRSVMPEQEEPKREQPTDPDAGAKAIGRLGRGHGLGRRWGGW